jgi:hypothetical protein
MAVVNVLARFREVDGRDSMGRASIWQGNAGALFGNNAVYADPIITVATVTTQARTTATAQYTIGGGLYSKASTDNFWTLGVAGSNTTVPINSWQKYALMVDDAGVATVQEATPSTVSAAAVRWPNVTALAGSNPANPWAPLTFLLNGSRCIFGILTVQTAAGTFVPGTTAIATAGAITVSFRGGIDPSLNPILANERGLVAGIAF